MGKTKGWHYWRQNEPRPGLIMAVTELFVCFLPVLRDACMWYWNREGASHVWNVCLDNWKNERQK